MKRAAWVVLGTVVLAACGSGGGGGGNGGGATGGIFLGPFPAASVVIGEPDFTTVNGFPGVSALNFGTPQYTPALALGRLYVSDTFRNRVLGYLSIPTANGTPADFVLGQPDFASSAAGTSASAMDGPGGCTSDGVRFAVADRSNHRILIWSAPPTTTNAPADVVVGQVDFASNSPGTTASTLNLPQDVQLAGGRLIVADSGNHRVLIWNTVPAANGQAADIVLGQPDFVTAAPGHTAAAFNFPNGVWSDGTRLAVAEEYNNRVLLWHTFPTASGTPPDVVLGQADFVSTAPGGGASGLDQPYDVTASGSQLLIADGDNHRIVVHDAMPTTNNRPADAVIGQSDFLHTAPDDLDQDNVADGVPSARTFEYPSGIAVSGSTLIVVDSDNGRVLLFTP